MGCKFFEIGYWDNIWVWVLGFPAPLDVSRDLIASFEKGCGADVLSFRVGTMNPVHVFSAVDNDISRWRDDRVLNGIRGELYLGVGETSQVTNLRFDR